MKEDKLADTLKDELVFIYQRQLKRNLKKKYECVFEGIAKQGDSTFLNSIYTDLYITQGCREQVNTEHEVRQIEVTSRRYESQEIQVECNNLFEAPEQDKEIRTVLTKGVAGIGKSVSVQKFVVDWAEGKENQDISFIFPLPFRELNLKDKETQSLLSHINHFFPETRGMNLSKDKLKVLFILDGLDECRLPLNFAGNETWSDVSSPASLDVLLTNLIKGNLLPSALIWITTRPAAASKIPPECIDRVTEVRGFNDAQKEEYFRKRFTDEDMAREIIDHVKQSKSLFIMCHIPVFCWISATVLQNILEEKRNNVVKNNQSTDGSKTLLESKTEDTPKTLTQMYTHFLRFQIQQSRRKYEGEYRPDVSWDKDAILSLGKLAFHQLQKNNLIFYDTDLEACGIDVYKASVYSGMCTQIFKEETGINIGTMYCFVHMSIQEFIAALYAHLFLDMNKKSPFVQDSLEQENKKETMIDLLKTAVDKALKSDNGHLDLFLRFLLGLSLESKKTLLRGLLTQQDDNEQSKEEIVEYIKQKFEANLSPERSINLFYCLNELNDQTLVKDIQTHLSKGSLSSADLSPAQWSAVAFVLLTSEEEMEEFELQKFKKSDECLIRLSPVIKTSKKALLNDCDLTDKSCSALVTVLESDTSLKELNMNNNNLQDSGVSLLCTGLKSLKCKLEILRFNNCALTEKSCSALALVLRSGCSSLKNIDLSNNNIQDSGVKLLCPGLESPNCKLEILRLSDCRITEEGYKALASTLRSNPSHLIELDLTGNDPGQSGVKELSDLLQSQKHSLKTLKFLSPAADVACKYLTKVLHNKNPLLMRELNLSGHKLGDTQVNQLASLLQDKHCKLNTLQLNNNSMTAEGCATMISALNATLSNLRELDMSENKLGNSGIENICHLLENPHCRLERLKLCNCRITEVGYKALASALRSNPSHLIELDLTGNDPGKSGVKELCDLLQDPNCHLKTLRLRDCDLTEKSCSALAAILRSNTSLKDLDLSNNNLQDSGVKILQSGLENCTLEKLRLCNCRITEEGYKALASALRSNPSHLKELDLTANDPGKSGVKELCDLLQDPNCQLKTLRFLGPAADEGCQFVTGIVGKNPLLMSELNLSGRKLGDTQVNQIAALLQDKHCTLNTIQLRRCNMTDECCSAVTSALKSNPSHLRELDLSENQIENTGVNHLCDVLKDSQYKLERLRLRRCNMTDECCSAVTSALKSNPSHLRELDLSENKLGDSGVKNLSDLLMNQQCKLETLDLCRCNITEKQCLILTPALKSNPSHLRELDLSENKLGDSGVKNLSDLLMNQQRKLEKLRLSKCSITEKQCLILTPALKSNPSHLKELDLSGNQLGQFGLKNLIDLLMNKQCKMEKLRLSGCSITEKQCLILTPVLCMKLTHLRELDLSGNKIENTGTEVLCDILRDSLCKLEKLSLNNCGITDAACLSQSLTVKKALEFLKELNLSHNSLGNSKEQLIKVLQNTNCKLR
ncbi:NACHT, LRR and PYD domains-containing protein 3-like [Carassius gibelio]|uniref:NACHT, LRR and PYD domains-containing protein 3-like n=1 Tax=Carassius gibelio TaxID=101364 RepID=UPI002278E970|nr:NACHT, LRR and PYD domains-containing protein 3-like [Carassius gibelio]